MSNITNKKTLVLIPAFNEEKNVSQVIKGVQRYAPFCDILVVDDASTDNTTKVAREAGAKVLTLPVNLGDGAARQTGFIYAKQKGYDFVVQLDGDGQHQPKYIDTLLEELKSGSFDLVIGSRFLLKNGYKNPITRRVGMILFNTVTSIIIGKKITDSTSGYRAMNKRALSFLSTNIFPQNFPDADVIIFSHFVGLRMKEVGAGFQQRNFGSSLHSGWTPIYYLYKMLLSIFVTLLRKRPSLMKGESNGT